MFRCGRCSRSRSPAWRSSSAALRDADGTGDDGPDRALLHACREIRNRAVHGPPGDGLYHGLADSEVVIVELTAVIRRLLAVLRARRRKL